MFVKYAFLLPKTKLLHLPSVRLQEKQAPPTFITGTLSDGYILLLGDQQKIQKNFSFKENRERYRQPSKKWSLMSPS